MNNPKNTLVRSADIFGAEIQYFRLDPRYWEPILLKFKDSGLRCVTTYVQWSTHLVGEPDAKHPAGVLDFEGRTHPRLNLLHFLDLIQKHGLDLNFRCGPFCCNEMIHGGYPEWLVMGDPNIMAWDYQNRTTQGYWIGKREGSQPSYLHPTYLEWCSKWIAEVDKIIQPRLKSNGGFITMLNLDNEVSYIVQDGFLTSDYNPVNVQPGGLYHQFLLEKYGAVDSMPYPKRFKAIEEVPAPRSVPPTVGADFAYYADWCEFKTWVMAGYIGKLRAMHVANGVEDVTFMTNFNPHRPEGIPTRMPAFERACGAGGIAGYDFYRGAFMSYSGYQSMARVLKLMNATLRYTWSAEFMAGTWNKILKTRVSDDHMMFMGLCALSQGCKAISWFMFHDRDCWGDAPVSSHGQARPSLGVLRDIRKLASEGIREWDQLVPQTDLGIIYDLASHEHTYLGDPSPCDDNAMHVGAPLVADAEAGCASMEYEGLFRLIEHTGRQAAVIDPVYCSENLDVKKMPLVLLPGSPVLHSVTLDSLAKYVMEGGKLIVTGPWPTMNRNGAPIEFLGGSAAIQSKIKTAVGQGHIWWSPETISSEADHDPEESIAWLSTIFDAELTAPHAHFQPIEPVSYVEWKRNVTMKSEGGHQPYTQPRNMLSGILHSGADDNILFLLNHYAEATRGRLTLANAKATSLENLLTGETIALVGGIAEIEIDRKTALVFRVC